MNSMIFMKRMAELDHEARISQLQEQEVQEQARLLAAEMQTRTLAEASANELERERERADENSKTMLKFVLANPGEVARVIECADSSTDKTLLYCFRSLLGLDENDLIQFLTTEIPNVEIACDERANARTRLPCINRILPTKMCTLRGPILFYRLTMNADDEGEAASLTQIDIDTIMANRLYRDPLSASQIAAIEDKTFDWRTECAPHVRNFRANVRARQEYIEDLKQRGITVIGGNSDPSPHWMRWEGPLCGVCGLRSPINKKCAQCKHVYYCGIECQRKDWKAHKRICSR